MQPTYYRQDTSAVKPVRNPQGGIAALKTNPRMAATSSPIDRKK
jgi:hypothetical protein